jgi:hypothetical protein
METLTNKPIEPIPTNQSTFHIATIFKRDYEYWEGVPRINIYLLRLLFILMFLFLGYDAWTHIFNHTGAWQVTDAVAWCVWGSYSIVSVIGIRSPLRMLPVVLLEIVYKTAWLLVVAYPLWIKNELIGSPAEYTTHVFLGVVAPMIFMPWRYFFGTYLLGKKTA